MNSVFYSNRHTSRVALFVLLCLLAANIRAEDPPAENLMVDKETVIRHYGPPTGSVTLGDREILTYPQGKVVLKDGKVVSMDFQSAPSPTPTPPTKGIKFLKTSGSSIRLSYDPDIWIPQTASPQAPGSMQTAGLTHQSGDFYLYLNVGAARVPKEYIVAGLLQRQQSLGLQLKVVQRENRRVAGGEVTYLYVIFGPASLRSAQHYYIYSGPSGTATVTVVGPNTTINTRIKDVMDALNGLEILPPLSPPSVPPSGTPAVKPEAPKVAF